MVLIADQSLGPFPLWLGQGSAEESVCTVEVYFYVRVLLKQRKKKRNIREGRAG